MSFGGPSVATAFQPGMLESCAQLLESIVHRAVFLNIISLEQCLFSICSSATHRILRLYQACYKREQLVACTRPLVQHARNSKPVTAFTCAQLGRCCLCFNSAVSLPWPQAVLHPRQLRK